MVCDFIPLKPTVNMPHWQEKARNNNALTYVEQVTNQTLSFSFILQQAIPVRDLKPAVVKVYDYDETDEAVFVEYSVPCNTGKQFTFHVSRLHFALKASPP